MMDCGGCGDIHGRYAGDDERVEGDGCEEGGRGGMAGEGGEDGPGGDGFLEVLGRGDEGGEPGHLGCDFGGWFFEGGFKDGGQDGEWC